MFLERGSHDANKEIELSAEPGGAIRVIRENVPRKFCLKAMQGIETSVEVLSRVIILARRYYASTRKDAAIQTSAEQSHCMQTGTAASEQKILRTSCS